jgi:alkylation response protein AidB-like acyl-CoA dehydrogenase
MAGIAAMGAEAIGAMEAMHEMTLDYLKTRKQFGRPIGDNQVLQHKAADMLVALEDLIRAGEEQHGTLVVIVAFTSP